MMWWEGKRGTNAGREQCQKKGGKESVDTGGNVCYLKEEIRKRVEKHGGK